MRKKANLKNGDWANRLTKLFGKPKKTANRSADETKDKTEPVSKASAPTPKPSRVKALQSVDKKAPKKFPTRKTSTIEKPAEPDWDALILEEIDCKGNIFASMLNLTAELFASERSNPDRAEQLVKKWEYAFMAGECAGLAHKFEKLQHDKNGDPEGQLKGLMELFHRLDLKKLNIQNPIVVSPENRFYFDNGTQFPDGTLCEISRWPWLYKEKVYYRGMLSPAENE